MWGSRHKICAPSLSHSGSLLDVAQDFLYQFEVALFSHRTGINGVATITTQAVAISRLGCSMLRGTPIKGLQGTLKTGNSSRRVLTPIRAAKLPHGVETPRDEPKLPVPFWGFTENAEAWNSRASMIGIFGIIIVEAIINRGILQAIGIDVGKGLDLPL